LPCEDGTTTWTDSSIVLTWIQDLLTNWKTSVSNRVAIVEEETSSVIGRPVPSQSNPADLISRGIEPSTFPQSTLWWKGPHRSSQELVETEEFAVNSSLKTLHPFLDKEVLLRVVGRLQHFTLPYQTRHQMILHVVHHFTNLVVSAENMRLLHTGPQLLIASLCEKYCIPRIRNLVKQVTHHCLTCYKVKAQVTQQFMGEFPSARDQPSRPFLNTGVDDAGRNFPQNHNTRSKTIINGYIAIFVCFATKAIHIEVVTSLTTEAFLAALRRFIVRRARPRTNHSDNGTNFEGSANELHTV